MPASVRFHIKYNFPRVSRQSLLSNENADNEGIPDSFSCRWAATRRAFIPASVRFLVNDNFPRASRQSCLSDEMDNNEGIPEAVDESPDIYLTAEEDPGKP